MSIVKTKVFLLVIMLLLTVVTSQEITCGRKKINWDQDRKELRTKHLGIHFMYSKPVYVLWVEENPREKYIVTLSSLIEFLDINENHKLDTSDKQLARISFLELKWNFTYHDIEINSSKGVLITLSSKIRIKHSLREHGPSQRDEIYVEIRNYLFESDTLFRGKALRGLLSLKVTIYLSKWLWHSDNALLALNITLKAENSKECFSEAISKGKYNTISFQAKEFARYLNITLESNVIIDGNSSEADIYLGKSHFLIIFPHYSKFLTYDPIIQLEPTVMAVKYLISEKIVAFGIILTFSIVSFIIIQRESSKLKRIFKLFRALVLPKQSIRRISI